MLFRTKCANVKHSPFFTKNLKIKFNTKGNCNQMLIFKWNEFENQDFCISYLLLF